MTTNPSTGSTFGTRDIALAQAIHWGEYAGNDAPCRHEDIVDTAKAFDAFLAGDPLEVELSEPASLEAVLAARDWMAPEWRQRFHIALVEAINSGLTWQAMAEGVGHFELASEFGRVAIKGVRGLQVFWVDDSCIGSTRAETSSWEIPRGLEIELTLEEKEVVMLGDGMAARVAEFVHLGIGWIDSRARGAIAEVMASAGFTSVVDEDDYYAVPPFRVEAVRWDGIKSREWSEDQVWHFWMKFKIGVAAFKVPEAAELAESL